MKYTEHLLNSFYKPLNSGVIQGADLAYKEQNEETGDAIKFYFVIDENVITNVKYQACGSIVLFASLSAITSLITNKSLKECYEVTEKQVIKEIKQVNRCDYSTITFAITALKNALNLIEKRIERIKENKGLRKVKVKNLETSKNITQHLVDETIEEKLENVSVQSSEIVEEKKEVKKAKKENKKQEVKLEEKLLSNIIEEDPITKPEEISALEDPVMIEEDEEYFKERDILETIPTKIEVRILDDEEDDFKENAIKEEPSIKTESQKIKDDEIGEDFEDEIDSITAKLTDAITKLNFKFDVDDDN